MEITTMQLTEIPGCPSEYEDVIQESLVRHYQRLAWEVRECYGLYGLDIFPGEIMQTPLAESLCSIARAAVGAREHAPDADGILAEEIQSVAESFFASPFSATYSIPGSFWGTGLGQMIARARLWLRDDLITISEAAEVRGVSVQAISQAVDAGRLTAFVDPDASQRQGRRLVSKSEVESM